MLQRMNELAVQASNGTNSESDRSSIQDEINQLTTEIDRVAETTKFNETYLLKGSDGKKTVHINAHDAGLVGTFSQNSITATFQMKALEVGNTYTIGGTEYEIGAENAAGAKTAVGLKDADKANYTGQTVEIAGKTWTFAATTDEELYTLNYDHLADKLSAGTTVKFNGKSATIFSDKGTDGIDKNNKTLITADAAYKKVGTELIAASSIGTKAMASMTDDDGADVTVGTEKYRKFIISKGTNETVNDLNFNLHVGADADMTNKIGVTIESMSSKSLGLAGINVSDSTGKAATYAIDAIADAVAKVSAQRSSLGAVQNRLEHTIANVDNVVENTNAAESRIRDTDMADEMVNYSKNNILAQAGQAMLAQANQSTQGVLSILG
jgi:flagellin